MHFHENESCMSTIRDPPETALSPPPLGHAARGRRERPLSYLGWGWRGVLISQGKAAEELSASPPPWVPYLRSLISDKKKA